jgi:hypothetical protein
MHPYALIAIAAIFLYVKLWTPDQRETHKWMIIILVCAVALIGWVIEFLTTGKITGPMSE